MRAGRTLSTTTTDLAGKVLTVTVPHVLSGNAPTDVTTTYNYTPGEGWLNSVVDPRGHTRKYDRDSAGRVTLTHLRTGGQTSVAYFPGTGWLQSTTDADGNTTTYAKYSSP